jgi:hypothetical protein
MAETETKSEYSLPPMIYVSVLQDDVFDTLKSTSLLKNISKELPGSPIKLFTYIESVSTSGGQAAEFTSLMLSASTLGVIPVVRNKDIRIHYRILVNQRLLTEYSYTNNFTDAGFFWAGPDSKLSKEAKAWIDSTIEQALTDLTNDEALKELTEEYNYYFSE